MYIAKRKSTNKWIDDFQSHATQEGLIKNAISRGIPKEDIEIHDISESEFKQIVDTELTQARLQAQEQDRLTQEELKVIGTAVATKLGLTKTQLKKFVTFMRYIDIESI